MKFIVFASALLSTGILASAVCHHDVYDCCTGCKPIVADDEGLWGAENGDWCLIDSEKCQGYHDPNYKVCKGCEVVVTDIEGAWGAENGEWCYIDEIICENKQSTEISEKPTENQNTIQTDASNSNEYKPSGVLPVIAITTSSGNSDALTKPVSKVVSGLFSQFIPDYVVPPEPYYEECTLNITDADGKSLISNAKANVKVRGNFTSNYPKKPLHIKFDKKQSILGMNNDGAYKNWILLSSYKDESLVRDVSVLSIAREIYSTEGYYVSDTRYVEVTINGEYEGVYILAEQQQIAEGRIEGVEPKKGYEGSDISYLLEHDGYAYLEDPLNKVLIDYHNRDPLKGYDGKGGLETKSPEGGMGDEQIAISSDINSQAQHDFIANYINKVYDIMYEAAYNNKTFEFNEDYSEIVENAELTPQQAVEKVVDVNSLALFYIINEIACDADVAFSSFYMDVDFSAEGKKKLRFEAPWDYDSALGIKRCENGQGLFAANIVPTASNAPGTDINPWLSVLMYQEWYQELIRKKWNEYYQKGAFNKAIDNIHKITETNAKAFEIEHQRWDTEDHDKSVAGEALPVIPPLDSQPEHANYVADWLKKRIEFINNHWKY
ncbi:hypothetical protein LY90DRAFT_699417 [Neocallimastix californiae]|uniref:CBM10 domain-containing protein n=1 Tax=Neocallimastix californiae TaxID=1754190 RepID=A0A1Y2ERX5_9FUNG|nr:hypothetical protein LY90DRAFT_699417 [Neocallimastix californiae]|eukprot:ORY73936.1 hypothetical protein LY90DRAFT_699417 [Neocallimastix californiae]